jgi:hypothetical protein
MWKLRPLVGQKPTHDGGEVWHFKVYHVTESIEYMWIKEAKKQSISYAEATVRVRMRVATNQNRLENGVSTHGIQRGRGSHPHMFFANTNEICSALPSSERQDEPACPNEETQEQRSAPQDKLVSLRPSWVCEIAEYVPGTTSKYFTTNSRTCPSSSFPQTLPSPPLHFLEQ